jgi:glycosyltransferase involved in cell wall biosynthesis
MFVNFNLFFNNVLWEKYLTDVLEKYEIDIVHVHDLPLVKTASNVVRKFNIPLVADLHENYPEAMRSYQKMKQPVESRLAHIIFPIWKWKYLEKSVLKEANWVITVVDEAKMHYISDCNVLPEKITVVMNCEDSDNFENFNLDEKLIEKYQNDFVISYIGGFGQHRGIDTAIKSMPNILKSIPEAKLLLIGEGPSEFYLEMTKLCQELNIENKVVFTGWVNFNLVPTYIKLSNVCLVPHHASGHTNTTIPHKLFQYMVMKKPIIVTDCPPLKRIIEETRSGLVIPSGDYNKMAEAVIQCCENPKISRAMGENGRKAIEEKYNWKLEAEKLCALYGRIQNERGNRSF